MVMQINLHAPFELTRACLPMLRTAADASIVFSGSATGRRARAYWGSYCVSKFAVEGLAGLIAEENEQGGNLRSNVLNPAAVRTGLRASAFPGEDPSLAPSPDDAVAPYLYLLGPDSRGITGQSFDLDIADLPSA